ELEVHGANDTLDGGTGNDHLIGDHDVVVAATVNGPVLVAGATLADYCGDDGILEIEGLVGSLELTGGNDVLHGGDGNDSLSGNSETRILGMTQGPLLTGTGAYAASLSSNFEELVEFEGLVCRIESSGGNDQLYGDAGDDSLIGDDVVSVEGVVSGQVASLSAGGTAYLGRN